MRAFVAFVLITISIATHASESKVHTLTNGHKIVSERDLGTKQTFVLLNGLVYATSRWNEVARSLHEAGHTVIRMGYVAQPESLRLLKKGEEPSFFKTGLDLPTLVHDLQETLIQLGIGEDRKLHLVGLSYGASVATEFAKKYPESVDQLILISPLVVSLDSYDPGGASLRLWLSQVRQTENLACDLYGQFNPYLCAFKDHWYGLYFTAIYQPYMNFRIKDVPYGVAERIYKRSMFHLVKAATCFNLKDEAPKLSNVHMLVASEDNPDLRRDQDLAWDLLNPQERRSFTLFKGAVHAIPDESPELVADVLKAIAEKLPESQAGEKKEVETK